MRPVVLAFSEHFLPAYKAGGTPRTLANMTELLGRDLSFRIVTRDRDEGDLAPLPGCSQAGWTQVGDAQVLYLSPTEVRIRRIWQILAETPCDVIYLNSCFSRYFSMVPLALAQFRSRGHRKPIVLAPRGEFSDGALGIHSRRKAAWLRVARAASLFDRVVWQASSEHEERDIRRVVDPAATIRIAPDLTVSRSARSIVERAKTSGSLRIAHLGRISAIKNLTGAFDVLREVRGNVDFHIMGSAANEAYLAECRARAATLPRNVRVHFEGAVAPDDVPARLERCHVLLALSLGENFGHVILEGLTAGCLPIVTDRTPWRGLSGAGVGWDLPLEQPELIRAAVQECVDLDGAAFAARSHRARAYAEAVHQSEAPRRQNLALFRDACDTEHRREDHAVVPSAPDPLR